MNTEQKRFQTTRNVGRAKHVVSFHDGVKVHKDGRPFFDLRIFANQRARDAFCRSLAQQGYAAR